jgi:hypothetical protein
MKNRTEGVRCHFCLKIGLLGQEMGEEDALNCTGHTITVYACRDIPACEARRQENYWKWQRDNAEARALLRIDEQEAERERRAPRN